MQMHHHQQQQQHQHQEEEEHDDEEMGVAETYADYWPAKCELVAFYDRWFKLIIGEFR